MHRRTLNFLSSTLMDALVYIKSTPISKPYEESASEEPEIAPVCELLRFAAFTVLSSSISHQRATIFACSGALPIVFASSLLSGVLHVYYVTLCCTFAGTLIQELYPLDALIHSIRRYGFDSPALGSYAISLAPSSRH